MMLQKPSQFQSATQRLARKALIATCGILSLGLLGAVSVHGGNSDQQVIYVQPEPAMLAATRDVVPVEESVKAVAHEQSAQQPQANNAEAEPAMTITTPKHIRLVRMLVTAYCPCKKCCGPNAHGVTASGKPVSFNAGHFVAADAGIPFGTHLIIPGYDNGRPVPVIDRGGAIKGNRLDVYFPTHQQALNWGRKWVMVTIID